MPDSLTIESSIGGTIIYESQKFSNFAENEVVILFAKPNAGYVFNYWEILTRHEYGGYLNLQLRKYHDYSFGTKVFDQALKLTFITQTAHYECKAYFELATKTYQIAVIESSLFPTVIPNKLTFNINEEFYVKFNLNEYYGKEPEIFLILEDSFRYFDHPEDPMGFWRYVNYSIPYFQVISYAGGYLLIKTRAHSDLNILVVPSNKYRASPRKLSVNCGDSGLVTYKGVITNLLATTVDLWFDGAYHSFEVNPNYVARGTQLSEFVSISGLENYNNNVVLENNPQNLKDKRVYSWNFVKDFWNPTANDFYTDLEFTVIYRDPTLTGSEIHTLTILFKDEVDELLGLEYIALYEDVGKRDLQKLVACSPCLDKYNTGQLVTLNLTSTSHYFGKKYLRTFTNWSGALAGSAYPEQLEILADTTVIAYFKLLIPIIKINKQVLSNLEIDDVYVGQITTTPINNYTLNDEVVCTAFPQQDYTFVSWSCKSKRINLETQEEVITLITLSNTNPTTLVLNAPETYVLIANYEKRFTLIITKPLGGGVTVNPSQTTYIEGTIVTLTAVADSGYIFKYNIGDIFATDTITTVTLNSNTEVDAIFEQINLPPVSFNVTFLISGDGFITKTPDAATYLKDSTINLEAFPGNGLSFIYWDIEDLYQKTKRALIEYTHTVTSETTITAYFAEILTLTILIPSNGGVVLVTPDKTSFVSGELVTLQAFPNSVNTFSHFEGDIYSNQSIFDFTILEQKTITAVFEYKDFVLNLTIFGEGVVNKTPNTSAHSYNSEVTLVATAGVDFSFSKWVVDSIEYVGVTLVITITKDTYVFAFFIPIPRYLTLTVNEYGSVTRSPMLSEYPNKSYVNLTASSNPNCIFLKWTGDILEAQAGHSTITIQMDRDKSIQAFFYPKEKSTLSNWKLLFSNDALTWLTAHVVSNKNVWVSKQVYSFTFDSGFFSSVAVLFRGFIAVEGFLLSTLHVYGNIFCLVLTTVSLNLELKKITTEFEGFFGIFEVTGHFYRILLPISSYFNLKSYVTGSLNIFVQNTVSVAFRMFTLVKGSMSIINDDTIESKIKCDILANFVTYIREGYVILNQIDKCRAIFIGTAASYKVSLELNTLTVTGFLQGSHSFIKLEPFVELLFLDLKGLVLIAGDFLNSNSLETKLEIVGGIPLPISIFFDITLGDIRPHLRLLLSIYVTIDSNKFYIASYFYGTTTTGYINSYFRNTTSNVYVFRGLKPSFYVYWATASISTDIRVRVNIQGVLDKVVNQVTVLSAGIVPFIYYGSLITSIDNTIISSISIRNNKNFFMEIWNLNLPDVQVVFGILVTISGSLSNEFLTLESFILATTPIAITANLTSQLWSPAFTAIGWIPLFGKNFIVLTDSVFNSHGSHSIGSLKKTLNTIEWYLFGRTVLKISITIDLKTNDLDNFKSYGYFLRTFCTINILIPSQLFAEIRLNTPIVNTTNLYGAFNQKLRDFNTSISLRLQLVHGTLEAQFNYSVNFMGWSLIVCTLNLPGRNLGLISYFVDNSHFISGILDFDLTRNTTNSSTIATSIKIKGFSSALITIEAALQTIELKINFENALAFRGILYIYKQPIKQPYEIPKDALPTPSAFIQALTSDFIYGKFEVTTQFFNSSNCVIFGIAARKIFGVLELTTVDILFTVELFFPFYLTLNSTLRNDFWFSKASNIVVYVDIILADLDVLKNKIIGTNAGSIFGIFTSSTFDFYNPIKTNIRLRVEIYGIFTPNKNEVSGYFRADASIVGSIFGGDTGPCKRGSPCYDENLLNSIYDKDNRLFWTLGYTTSLIYMHFKITTFTGVLNAQLSSPGRVTYTLYTSELNRYDVLIFELGTFDQLAVQMTGHVAIQGILDGLDPNAILWSFIGYQECEIRGLISVSWVGTFDATFTSGVLESYIELRNLAISGKLFIDLPLLKCEFFGFIAIGVKFLVTLKPNVFNCIARIRIPIECLFTNKLDNIDPSISANRLFQVYGTFSNYYLFWLYGTFLLKTKIVGHIIIDLEQHNASIVGLSLHVYATMTLKLPRIFVKIILEHNDKEILLGTIFCNLQPVNLTFVISVPNLGKIPGTLLSPCTANLTILVPIRIYVDFRAFILDTVFSDFKMVAMLGVTFVNTFENVEVAFELFHHKPINVNLDLNLDLVISDILLLAYPIGTLILMTDSVFLQNQGFVGNSYGYFITDIEELLMTSDLWVSEKSVYLPCEKLYTVAGKLDSANRAMEYRLDLYDADSGEKMQSIATLNIPFSYSFDKIDYGRFVVLATPVYGARHTQAYSVLIDDEV